VIFGIAVVFPVVITFGVAGVWPLCRGFSRGHHLRRRRAWQGEQLPALTSTGRCAPVNNEGRERC